MAYGASKDESVQCHLCDLLRVTELLVLLRCSGNLDGESKNASQTTVEDVFIRKFMSGTWHGLFVSELIIKRRHNLIIIAGIINQTQNPTKIYFLKGYTEELLSHLFRRPIRIEVQTVQRPRDVHFKWI